VSPDGVIYKTRTEADTAMKTVKETLKNTSGVGASIG
jgi:hypothetical protein